MHRPRTLLFARSCTSSGRRARLRRSQAWSAPRARRSRPRKSRSPGGRRRATPAHARWRCPRRSRRGHPPTASGRQRRRPRDGRAIRLARRRHDGVEPGLSEQPSAVAQRRRAPATSAARPTAPASRHADPAAPSPWLALPLVVPPTANLAAIRLRQRLLTLRQGSRPMVRRMVCWESAAAPSMTGPALSTVRDHGKERLTKSSTPPVAITSFARGNG
jgi:hypothetical protein